jgi:hypothetical protein
MSSAFEPVMAALFAHLQAAATLPFTADATATTATLANVSNFTGLFAGLPVFGPGVPRGATILSLNAGAGTVTLSSALAANGTTAQFKTGFLTTGRRVQHWSQVTAQPALFLRRIGTHDEYSGHQQITTLDCEVWIYSQAGKDPDAIPDEALSNLDRMVRTAFTPEVYGDARYTIGGLVYWCRIEGHSDYSPGDQGGQGISRIPVRITLDPGL